MNVTGGIAMSKGTSGTVGFGLGGFGGDGGDAGTVDGTLTGNVTTSGSLLWRDVPERRRRWRHRCAQRHRWNQHHEGRSDVGRASTASAASVVAATGKS
jgi:hypothetical protein